MLLKLMMFPWPGRVKEKVYQAEYYLEKDGMCKNGVVNFGEELTLAEARKEIASRCEISPDDQCLRIFKLT